MNKTSDRGGARLGAYIVGAYLFSVPAFAYSDTLGLLIVPQLTGALLAAYAALDVLARKTIQIPQEVRLYGLFGLWAAATFIFGASTSDLRPLGTLLKVVLATLACAQLIKDDADLHVALKIFVFSILLVYYQNRADLQLLRMTDRITDGERFAGTLANANTAAIFAVTVIWASALLLLSAKGGVLARSVFIVPVGIALMIVYYSGSKKGYIGIGLFVLFFARSLYLGQRSSRQKKLLAVVVALGLIIIMAYFIYSSPFFFRIQEAIAGDDASTSNRWELAGEAVNVWLRSPKTFLMGVGWDNFRLFSEFQTYSHSTPLELLASNGVVGFGLFMGFIVLMFRNFVVLYRRTSSPMAQSAYFSSLIYLSIFFVFMVAAVLHDSRELLPILGCLAAYGQHRMELERQPA